MRNSLHRQASIDGRASPSVNLQGSDGSFSFAFDKASAMDPREQWTWASGETIRHDEKGMNGLTVDMLVGGSKCAETLEQHDRVWMLRSWINGIRLHSAKFNTPLDDEALYCVF